MKKFIIVNGTMGVGKTSTCEELLKLLKPSVFLDGDWCWYMKPFKVTDETKEMVIDNICHVLSNFLNCSEYDYVIFCWVMHYENIIDDVIKRINQNNYIPYKITLTCSPETLEQRLSFDINSGCRTEDVIERSLQRLNMYQDMDTYKIDVSDINQYEAAKRIIEIIK